MHQSRENRPAGATRAARRAAAWTFGTMLVAAVMACGPEGTQSQASSETAAIGSSSAEKSGPYARAKLLAEHASVAPGTQTRLAIHLDLDPEWHVYWNGRNDTGFPVTPEFDVPTGWTLGETRWPAPVRHISEGEILDHVYEVDATLIVPVEIGDDALPGMAEVVCRLDWVVCKDVCVFESDTLTVKIPVADSASPPAVSTMATTELLAKTEARVPRPAPEGTFEWRVKDTGIELTVPEARSLQFFPGLDCAELSRPIEDAAGKGKMLHLRLKETDREDRQLTGVLQVETGGGSTQWFDIEVALQPL